MKPLTLIWLTLIKRVKQVCQLPQMIMKAGKQQQQQAVLNKREAERLDRILNPSKYWGK